MIGKDYYEENTPLNVQEKENMDKLRSEVYQDLILKRVSFATEKIAEYIKNKYIIKTIKSDVKKELWVYKEGIYENLGETTIQVECRNILQEAYLANRSQAVIDKIITDTIIDKEEFFNQQNKYQDLIAVNNGILNIETRKLIPFNPKIYFFNKLPVNYDSSAECNKIIHFVEEITEKEEDVKTIQEIIGYSLLKEYKYEKAFMLHGTGRNGKSKLLDLIELLIGGKNISSTPLGQLEEDDSFSIINLHNKLVNIAADVTKQALKDSGIFKSLVGRDTIQARRKFKEAIEFKNYAKLIFATNTLPEPKMVSEAFWLRWVVIRFPMKFLPQKEIDAIPLDKRSNVKLQNPTLLDDLSGEEEISGLLNWALNGLDRLIENKDFTFTKTVKVVQQEWLRQSNSLIAFCDDCVIEDYDSFMTRSSFKQQYLNYCRKHKITSLSDRAIASTLTNNYAVVDTRRYIEDVEAGNNKQVRIWDGIRLKFLGEESQSYIS
jgi:putative DNA primase/helicase